MKPFYFCFAILLFSSNIFAQSVQIISQGKEADSSYYHIAKISSNEYWAGGEYGVLTKIDSLGNQSSINFPNDGKSILKIEKVNNYVFIATADAVIYRYDIEKKVFVKKVFKQFKNKCFYDLVPLANGNLMVCGGATGISNGVKKIPRGFIGIINQDLDSVQIVWSCYRKFVWSLLPLQNGEILAATFNGFNTKLIKTVDNLNWEKVVKIKGLVHEITLIDSTVWFAGSKNVHYNKCGIIGNIKNKKIETSDTGCLWSMDEIGSKTVTVSNNGKLIVLDKVSLSLMQINTPSPYAIYDVEKISNSKLIAVGHAKTIMLVSMLVNE